MGKFDVPSLRKAVAAGRLRWQLHALERMMERGIFRAEVLAALLEGEVIEEYLEDKPFPSCLLLQAQERQPLHVVAALDADAGICHVITAYLPDIERFEADYKTRRKKP